VQSIAVKAGNSYEILRHNIICQEMFNNTAIWKGDWKAVKNMQPAGDGQWHLFNYTADIAESNDLASQNPEKNHQKHFSLL
jgi:arylsulfatase A-like enzyme